MKKIYTIALMMAVSLGAYAQSFTVSGPKTIFSFPANKPTNNYTFFNFETGKEVDKEDSNSTKWDIGFSGTTIILNGGTSGPGSVTGQVVTSNFEDLISAPASGYNSDGANGKAVPTGTGNGWYNYNSTTHIITPIPNRTIVVKLEDGSYVKMEVINYYLNAPLIAGGTGKYYSFRYLHSQTTDLDNVITSVSNLRADYNNYQFFNLSNADTVLTADSNSTKWDIAFKGTTILVNSGSSGPGEDSAQVVAVNFDDYNTAPQTGWDYDDASGKAIPTGSGKGWYNYSGAPSHLITPIDNKTILVKTSLDRYVKIQIESYYKDGNSGVNGSYYSFSYYFQPDGSTDLATTSTATGIHKGRETDRLINVYPNPFDGKNLNIQSEISMTNAKVTILNAQGVAVASTIAEGAANDFTVSDLNLTPGIYIIQIETGSETLTKKLMVK